MIPTCKIEFVKCWHNGKRDYKTGDSKHLRDLEMYVQMSFIYAYTR